MCKECSSEANAVSVQMFGVRPNCKMSGFCNNSQRGTAWLRYARLRRAISEIRSLLRTPSPPEACVPISIPPGLRRSGRRRVESGHRGKPVAYPTSYKLILRLRRPPRRSLERITRSPERQSLSTMCCGEAARWVGMNFYCVFRTTQFDIAR